VSVFISADVSEVVRAWLEAGFPGRFANSDLVAACSAHVRAGIDSYVRGWDPCESVRCGVDGCETWLVDPVLTSWLLVFSPGLDVVPLCSGCFDRALRDTSGTSFYVVAGGES
jgi:hypothetical protein